MTRIVNQYHGIWFVFGKHVFHHQKQRYLESIYALFTQYNVFVILLKNRQNVINHNNIDSIIEFAIGINFRRLSQRMS